MPADMTQVIDAIAAEVADLYPTIAIIKSKRPSVSKPPGDAGWNLGTASTAFVISGLETENVDATGTFEEVSVGYKVLIEYIKPAEKTVAGETGRPPRVAEDPDVRDKRQAIRRRIYKPQLGSIPSVSNVANRPSVAYDWTGGTTLVASGQLFEFELYEPRAEETT